MRIRFWPAIQCALCSLLLISQGCTTSQADGPVEMKVHSIGRIPSNGPVAIILVQADGKGLLPILVDSHQALSIYLGHNKQQMERPLTHDLMFMMLENLNARVESITINGLEESTYTAKIKIKSNGETKSIDARPSDAIALALRTASPIYAMPHLLERNAPARDSGLAFQAKIKSWGFTVQAISGNLRRYFDGQAGVLVTALVPDGRAANGGLRVGDIITGIGGHSMETLQEFTDLIAGRQTNDALDMQVKRDDRSISVRLKK